ncbi:LAQU0S08e03576g1_1 [Lachancea quebecensis]|uniref:LAQU0S08e03576g1_1 n=1 Tax=Lachancea quebecensis TaxID=1654605 RepID=A0A0P1KSJ9_9SACH|nr:LAQU0S08e03576g1_1 [Lachancea quebecensis]
MVLYKRKPIILPPPRPLPSNINIKVWHINESGEWFTKYTEYLERMDFYMRRQFTCEITGTSCLTFFEALNSEEMQFRAVEEKFPLKLREPVAKFLHFNETRRVDMLVEQVYSRFKKDFYPGERVYLSKKIAAPHTPSPLGQTVEENDKPTPLTVQNLQRPYLIKEKASFNAVVDLVTKEEIRSAYSKYMVTEEFGSNSLMVDEDEIFRDRCTFTKHLIKCFCKITLRRASPKIGAPLCVKDEYLSMYGLTLDWPLSMLQYKVDIPVEPVAPSDALSSPSTYHGHGNQEDRSAKRPHDQIEGELHKLKRPKSPSAFYTPYDAGELQEPKVTYNGSNKTLQEAFCYSQNLNRVPITQPGIRFNKMHKLLEVYQFFQTFSKILCISPFCLDAFIFSLKFTDVRELEGIKIQAITNIPGIREKTSKTAEALTSNTSGMEKWAEEQTPGICEFLESQKTPLVSYSITKSRDLSDSLLEDVTSNGTALIIECFVALERLFIDEKSEWRCLVVDQWYDSEEEQPSESIDSAHSDAKKTDNEEKNINEKKDEISNPEIDDLLEKCLNYRNVNWSERLSKRQFRNGFWLIILLGIFQDCIHLPMYTDFIHKFVKAVVPPDSSTPNLNKVLWQNFSKNLRLEDKLEALWILVDVTSNFSQDIKVFIEDTMEVCVQIRSERLKISKRLKTETATLVDLNMKLKHLENSNEKVLETTINEIRAHISAQQEKIDNINKDRETLNQKLIENDIRRLNSLGMDRNGNRYYWQELCGVQRTSGENDTDFGSGRLWIQGTSVEDAERLLQLPTDSVSSWKKLLSSSTAGQVVDLLFPGAGPAGGKLVPVDYHDNMAQSDLKNLTDDFESLSSIQRKILDESIQGLLLGEHAWAYVEAPGDIDELIMWLTEGGSLDQTLLRQVRSIKPALLEALSQKQKIYGTQQIPDNQEALIKRFEENKIDESDAHACQNGTMSDHVLEDEKELEAIAEEIMALDDTASKTRTALNRVKELEERRDFLLNKRTFESHATRIQSRAQHQKLSQEVEKKLEAQETALTECWEMPLSSLKFEAKNWKNWIALDAWGVSLYAGATGKAKNGYQLSIKQRMADIFGSLLSYEQADHDYA